jgi:CheY-like chemotaxis protein
MKRILADTPYQALSAESVRQTQRVLKHIRPAAILLDILLVGDESWRLMLQLRQHDAYANIPLVVVSSAGEQQKAIHLGADEYLAKPIDGQMLINLLDRLTGRQSITKVLLVDDEEVTRYLVRQLLPRSRYSLCAVGSGSEGHQHLRDERPDVILLDINMPDVNGYQFLERVHADANVAGLPVIVLTSAILGPSERKLLQRATRIVSKSELSSSTLIDTIEDVLRRDQPMLAE